MYFLHRLLVGRGALHSNEKMILIFNQKNNDALVQAVLLRSHGVTRMGQHAGLEDSCEVVRVHSILVRLCGKYRKQIKDVKEKLAIQGGKLGDELLVLCDRVVHIEVLNKLWSLSIGTGLLGSPSQRFTKLLVQIQGHDWLREVVEVAPEHVGGIVNSITIPH